MGKQHYDRSSHYSKIQVSSKEPNGNHFVSNATHYSEGSIKIDLTEARPQWKLSNYGPAKEEPNLIVGVDRSVEEDRFLYYTSMRTTGNNTQYASILC